MGIVPAAEACFEEAFWNFATQLRYTARIDLRMDALMLNDSDTVGHTFKRACYRVDGVTMYVCWAIWAGKSIWALFDPENPGIYIFVLI